MSNPNHQANGKFGSSEKVKVECAVCGKKMLRTIASTKGKSEFYCGCECLWQRGSKRKVRKTCLYCKKEFTSYVSENKRYCSRECHTGSGRREYICIVCNKRFIKKRCYEKKNIRYCSRECFHKNMKKDDRLIGYWNSLKGKQPKNMRGLELGRGWNKKPRKVKMIFCACDCGGRVNKYDKKNRVRKLLLGHMPKFDGSFTSIEKKVYEELKRRGLLFETQKVINGKFRVDAYIPGFNLVIEADGDYWHSLPKVQKRDKAKNAYLKKCGYNLLRMTEMEINNGQFKQKIGEVVNG